MRKILFLFLIVLINCKNTNTDYLQLKLITKEIIVHCNESNCSGSVYLLKKKKAKLNKIVFQIENRSSKNIIFNPISEDINKGNPSYSSFPKLFTGISLNNIIIRDSEGNIVVNDGGILGGESEIDIQIEKNTIQYFKKLGYNLDDNEALYKGLSLSTLLVIPSKTTYYFESYLSLPLNLTSESISSIETIKLDVNNSYTLQLFFKANKKAVINRLPKNIIKTIREGNFEIFDGNLFSNKIPIEISNYTK
ncbi:hypothetical protein JL193_09455 [Polaribacter batillariae]|uniref:Lipoprotein n=1 Tax=Polaribacter batillariae TaxID=2808900 RepID=A0ABX7SQI7_9FLAO|nr:hypothetical protein [Polaribacter batillariae]QTD36386.1 hypothetical protein JL193_09455 [Polaribacter batillariae]